MRYSTDKSDPGYSAYQALREQDKAVRVWVDGVEHHFCETVDEEQGLVIEIRKGEGGNFIVEDDVFVRFECRGVVKTEIYHYPYTECFAFIPYTAPRS